EQDNAASVLYQPDTSGLPVSEQGFIWPLSGPITSYFGPRWVRMHTGIDIDGTTGAPVVAAASGRVAWAGYYGGYGNAVVIAHSNGLSTLYGHLATASLNVGQEVLRGETVGAVGCTGSCTGDHLHFEVRVDGVPVDPLLYLPGGSLFVGGSVSDQPPEEEGFSDHPDPVESPAPSSEPPPANDQGAIAPPPAPTPTSEATR
ncbi:MAG: M23 family metallopeptidase, partial [Actinomycetota bacterium]